MSIINLILLNELNQQPWNAYELAKHIQLLPITPHVKISQPAIYKNILKLHDQGYLNMTIERNGNMPHRKIYTINNNGNDYLVKLCDQYAYIHTLNFDWLAVLNTFPNLDQQHCTTLLNNIINTPPKPIKTPYDKLQLLIHDVIKEWINDNY
jgi:DNA-binding PadR family transcriptional regulator